jgi:di/tricarboxylate transporter
MVVGMAAGSLVFLELAGWTQAVREPAAILAGMFAGMVWGMVASVTLVQALVRLRLGPRTAPGGPH